MDASEPLMIAVAAVIAGGIASISGFGIGSLLTPVLSLWYDAKLAVAAISIPHLIGTALRFWLLKGRADARVMWSFGLASAAGGIAGALLNIVFESRSGYVCRHRDRRCHRGNVVRRPGPATNSRGGIPPRGGGAAGAARRRAARAR